MLSWALLFFVLAIVLGVLGFGGFVTGTLLVAAKFLVVAFVILAVVFAFTGRSVPPPTY